MSARGVMKASFSTEYRSNFFRGRWAEFLWIVMAELVCVLAGGAALCGWGIDSWSIDRRAAVVCLSLQLFWKCSKAFHPGLLLG
jgi:hypothetical protein